MINEASSPGASLEQGCRPDSVAVDLFVALLIQTRNDALEEAASYCAKDADGSSGGYTVACETHAYAIRALKTPAMKVGTPSSETLSR